MRIALRASLALVLVAACSACGSDGRVQLTVVPGDSLTQAMIAQVATLEIVLSGADSGRQTFNTRVDGSGKLFSDGLERVVYVPQSGAQGNLVIDVVARGVDQRPIGKGQAQVPLLRGQSVTTQVLLRVPASCEDEVQDKGEGDVDCGGTFCEQRCALGRGCNDDGDCEQGSCVQHKCAPASCANGVKDGDETDGDCGGACAGCANDGACAKGADCRSGVCSQAGACTACVASSDCAAGQECVEGVCKAPSTTTRSCSLDHGMGTQTFAGNAWGPCQVSACDPGYHVAGTACEGDSRTCVVSGGSGIQMWNGAAYGPCVATGCSAGQHLEAGACVADTKTCATSNGQGTQTWNGVVYGPCTATSCNAGYHVEAGACASNTRACDVTNGSGTQAWTGASYGGCTPSACNAGYHLEAGTCTGNVQACTETTPSPGSGTRSWNGFVWGPCNVTSCQTSCFVPQNGDCVPPLCSSQTSAQYQACWPDVAAGCTSYCTGSSNPDCIRQCGDTHRNVHGAAEGRCQ